jgi:hypothetical protein
VLNGSFARSLNEQPSVLPLRYIIKPHIPSIEDYLASTLHNSNLETVYSKPDRHACRVLPRAVHRATRGEGRTMRASDRTAEAKKQSNVSRNQSKTLSRTQLKVDHGPMFSAERRDFPRI